MAIILLDTDIIIEFLNDNVSAVTLLQELSSEYTFSISIITKAEIIQGVRNKQHQAKLLKGLDDLTLINIDESTSELFTHLFSKYYLSHQCAIPDVLNAAVAINKNVPLLTLNIKDYGFIDALELFPHNIKPKRTPLNPDL